MFYGLQQISESSAPRNYSLLNHVIPHTSCHNAVQCQSFEAHSFMDCSETENLGSIEFFLSLQYKYNVSNYQYKYNVSNYQYKYNVYNYH